jgi:hypothetical protein
VLILTKEIVKSDLSTGVNAKADASTLWKQAWEIWIGIASFHATRVESAPKTLCAILDTFLSMYKYVVCYLLSVSDDVRYIDEFISVAELSRVLLLLRSLVSHPSQELYGSQVWTLSSC